MLGGVREAVLPGVVFYALGAIACGAYLGTGRRLGYKMPSVVFRCGAWRQGRG